MYFVFSFIHIFILNTHTKLTFMSRICIQIVIYNSNNCFHPYTIVTEVITKSTSAISDANCIRRLADDDYDVKLHCAHSCVHQIDYYRPLAQPVFSVVQIKASPSYRRAILIPAQIDGADTMRTIFTLHSTFSIGQPPSIRTPGLVSSVYFHAGLLRIQQQAFVGAELGPALAHEPDKNDRTTFRLPPLNHPSSFARCVRSLRSSAMRSRVVRKCT